MTLLVTSEHIILFLRRVTETITHNTQYMSEVLGYAYFY